MRRLNCKLGVVLFSLLGLGLGQGQGAPPPNDACATAEVIPGSGPFPYLTELIPDVSEAEAAGDPIATCGDMTHTLWYRFMPSVSGDYTISTASDTGTTVEDTFLAVYSSAADCSGPFEEVDCEDDEAGLRAALSVTLTVGTTYYVVVGVGLIELSEDLTAVQLRVSKPIPPANDTCAGAEVIPSGITFPYWTQETDVTLATSEGDPTPSCASSTARGIWYAFTPAESTLYKLSTCEDSGTTVYDTVLAVYESSKGCAGPLEEVGCSENGCGDTRASLSISLVAGRPYLILVAESFPSAPEEPVFGETVIQLRVDRFEPAEVATSPASGITSSGAQLNGVVNPNGVQTDAWFEWGTSTSYGHSTAVQAVGSGEFPTALNGAVNFPELGVHHFRLVATNILGRQLGEDQAVQWDGTPPMLAPYLGTNLAPAVYLQGVTRQIYWVEGSFDLRDWITLGTAVETAVGSFEYDDVSAIGLPHRFYRALAP